MNILAPIKVGNMQLKNRIMFPPLTTGYESRDGSITDQCMAFYERLAKGGIGYIVLGDVSPVNSFSPTPKLYKDEQIPMYTELTNRIHSHGAKLAAQIFYPEYDLDALTEFMNKGDMVALRAKLHHDMLHYTNEVSIEKLEQITDLMVKCAIRCEKAGMDAIEIHGDRLTGTLCSPILNHRTDIYGGSFVNRTFFALELVKRIKEAVPNMTLDYKFTVCTEQRGKGGIPHSEATQFAKLLEKAGVDMLHVAQANHTGDLADTIPPMGVQPYGFFVDIAGEVKKVVSIPVSTVGRIITPEMAERIIECGKADIIGIGRPLLADPDWLIKAAQGKSAHIRKCISCNKGCTDNIQNRKFLSCILNAENGYEGVKVITKAENPQNITIIGGGIAGMEAARVAIEKGHKVTLFERSCALGGQINIACIPPRKAEMKRATEYLVNTMLDSDIVLNIGKAPTTADILATEPDHVIIAIGAESFFPPIDGIGLSNVCDAWKILDDTQQAYGNVAIIGGGLVGCETAEYLATQGCKISIVEMTDKIAGEESNTVLPTMLKGFKDYGVVQYLNHKVDKITEHSLICTDKDGKTVTIPCDYVVVAVGSKSLPYDVSHIIAKNIQCHFIGDCKERPSDISSAIRSAYDTVNAIN